MTEDASLSDFNQDDNPEELERESDSADESETVSDPIEEPEPEPEQAHADAHTDTDSDDLEQTAAEIDPAITTYAWGTYVCANCDESVDRVWRRESHLVCEECVEW